MNIGIQIQNKNCSLEAPVVTHYIEVEYSPEDLFILSSLNSDFSHIKVLIYKRMEAKWIFTLNTVFLQRLNQGIDWTAKI